MYPTPSRWSEPSHARLTFSGLPSTPPVTAGLRSIANPNFVAISNRSRRPATARPTSSSFVCGP